MWQRFSQSSMRIVGHYLGVLLQFLACAMVVPFITGLACFEWEPASRYLLGIGVALIAGSLLRFLRVQPPRLNRQQALAITGLAWIVLSIVATLPLYLSGHFGDYLDALFESTSGLTTTGVTLAQDLDHLSNADNMWRFVLQFLGGIGLVSVALSLGLFGRRIDAGLYASEAHTDLQFNVITMTRFIAKAAFAFVFVAALILAILCMLIGMDPVRSVLHGLWLSIAGFMTGGFAPMQQSVMYYHFFAIEFVLMIVMLLGSLSFVLMAQAAKSRTELFFKDFEVRTLAVWITIMTVIFAAAVCADETFSAAPILLRRGLFTVISSFSTTGFQVFTTEQLMQLMPSGALLVLAIMMLVGGCASSTAGGIKLSRIGLIAKSTLATFKRTLAPDSARIIVEYEHLGRRRLDDETVKEALMMFMFFVVVCGIGALAGVAYGSNAIEAIVDSVVVTCNGGISSGIANCDMPVGLEMVYLFQMWAGRLEFVTLGALLIEVVVTLIPRRRGHSSAHC